MTEEKDDGMCRSCVGNKCVTGSECVTLGRDASPPRAIPAEQAEPGACEACGIRYGYHKVECPVIAAEQAAPTEPIAQVVADMDGKKRVIFHSYKALHETPLWTKLYAHPHEAADRSAEAKDGARRWLAVVQQKADGARENAQALRKFPGQEQEARARELAAVYLVETAHLMAMDEAHAESLEALHASSQRVAKVLAAMGTPAAAEPGGGDA